jgi:hypothetical protein
MINKRLIIGLLAVLIVFFGAYYFFRRYREEAPSPLAEVLPPSQEEESALELQVGLEIPEGVEKARLADVRGGDSIGIATRKTESGKFEHTIIASLPDPGPDEFYQGWLAKGEEIIPTAKMEEKKGGWVLSYTTDEARQDYDQAVVSLETQDDDQPEEKVLEGEF